MNEWILIEVRFDGSKRVLEGEYGTWDESCEAQEAMEWLHDENSYLVYTVDEWMYEVENGRA